jgi:MFS family permease
LQILSKLKKEFAFIQGNYLILVLSWILMDFAMELPGTYYPRYVEELAGSPFIVGVIGFAAFLALASVQFPGGYLADKYGRRWLVSTMTFGVALSYIFYAAAPVWHFIFVGALIGNLCLIYQPALLAMTADSLPSERRGMGFSIIMLITRVATTPAPAVAGLLYAVYGLVPGMRIGYVILVAFFLTAAILRSRLKETVGQGGKINPKELLNSYPKAIKESSAVWKIVPRSMLYLFIAGLFGTFSNALVGANFLFYAKYQLGISEALWWQLQTYLVITIIILALPCGKLVDKIGRKIPLLLSYLLFIPSILLFMYGDLQKLLLALPLVGLANVLMMSAVSSLQADLVPKAQRGKVIGFTNFVNYILVALGMLTGGFLYEHINPQLPFSLLLVCLIPQFLVTIFLVHEPEKRED